MVARSVVCCLFLIFSAWPLSAQLTVTSRQARQLIGVENAETIGTGVFVAGGAVVKLEPVVLVEVGTQAANITFEASDASRTPVEFEQLTGQAIAVRRPGKTWVDVTVIDFDQNIYGRKSLVVELGDRPGPVPPIPPDPDDPDPVPPDPDGPFDGLAAKVASKASGMSTANRGMIAVVLLGVADKMQRFEYRQMSQAREYIKRNWPTCDECVAVYQLLIDDSSRRILSWQETQAYYREVAKGVR